MVATLVLVALAYNYANINVPPTKATTTQDFVTTIFPSGTSTTAIQSTYTSTTIANTELVWSANFESGTEKDFNDTDVNACGGMNAVSTLRVHSGTYAGYYNYTGGSTNDNCRAYPTEVLSSNPSQFLLELWVYVPKVQLRDWVSFATLHLSDDTFITIDSNARQQIHLYMTGGEITEQAKPITWSFDTWFKIGIRGDLHPGTTDSKITVYQDDVPIINFTGFAGNGLLWRMHFGLYISSKQGTFAVYNDDITLTAQ